MIEEYLDEPCYISLKTGKRYPRRLYLNHGYGGKMYEKEDLPKNGYPYSVEIIRKQLK